MPDTPTTCPHCEKLQQQLAQRDRDVAKLRSAAACLQGYVLGCGRMNTDTWLERLATRINLVEQALDGPAVCVFNNGRFEIRPRAATQTKESE